MTSTASTKAQSSSQRYDALHKLLANGMGRSRKALHLANLVETAYGEDAGLFGGTEMLVGALEDMMEKVHEQVDRNMVDYCESHQVEALLLRVEKIAAQLEEKEAAKAQAEAEDQASAIRAMDANLLPAGVTLEDVVQYSQYQQALVQKENLQQALANIQEEIDQLEKDQENTQQHVQKQQRALEDVATELARSADVCSLVAS